MVNYGEFLREQRLSMGLSQNELARRTGISHQNIQRWEKGLVIPNIDFCAQLADFYGITIDELIGRDMPKNEIYNEIHHNNVVNINQGAKK